MSECSVFRLLSNPSQTIPHMRCQYLFAFCSIFPTCILTFLLQYHTLSNNQTHSNDFNYQNACNAFIFFIPLNTKLVPISTIVILQCAFYRNRGDRQWLECYHNIAMLGYVALLSELVASSTSTSTYCHTLSTYSFPKFPLVWQESYCFHSAYLHHYHKTIFYFLFWVNGMPPTSGNSLLSSSLLLVGYNYYVNT